MAWASPIEACRDESQKRSEGGSFWTVGELAVVADDLTGANATGVLFAKKGLKVATITNYRILPDFDFKDWDGLVVNTSSRGLPPAEAHRRVEEAARTLKARGISYFGKRIDSTARGNLGAEIEGVLEALGPDYIAVVVPAYPASGRIVTGGYLLVNGVPVERTEVARDPKTPVDTSEVCSIIARQSVLAQGLIPLSTVAKGVEAIRAKLMEAVAFGRRIVVIDATSDEDIENIAQAVSTSGVKAIAVDPGPFSAALLMRLAGSLNKTKPGKVMVVSGSASSLTRLQLDYLGRQYGARFINVDVRELLDKGLALAEWEETVGRLKSLSEEASVFGLRVAEKEEMVLDLEREAKERGLTAEEVAGRITAGLARLAYQVLKEGIPNLKGVFVTGGDMTVAFCEACGARAIELKGEVLPLAAHGVLVGGELAGLPVVTKGGLVGGPDGALRCVAYLMERL